MPSRHVLGIDAAGVDQDINPLVRRELLAFFNILIKVDDAHLKRGKRRNFKRSDLLIVDLCFIIGKINRSPHAA